MKNISQTFYLSMRAMVIVNIALFSFYSNAYASGKRVDIPVDISVLYGNFVNTETNEWTYGFFENFAIYDSKFWDYKSASIKKNKVNLVLSDQQNQHEIALSVEIGKDSLFTVKQGTDKKKKFFRFNGTLPSYKYSDKTEFKSPTFSPDSVTIIGYYQNYNRLPEGMERWKSTFSVSVFDFIRDEDVDYYVDIDSFGRFKITFPVINAQEIFMDGERLNETLIAESGDTFFLYVDLLDLISRESDGSREGYLLRPKKVIVMGDNSRVNNELIQYGYYPGIMGNGNLNKYDNYEISDIEYYSSYKENYDFKTAALKEYTNKYTVSSKFLWYKESAHKYEFLRYLMQRRFVLFFDNSRNILDDEFMKLVEENVSLNDELTYTLISEFGDFLQDYIGYVTDITEDKTHTVTFEMIAEEMERQHIMTPKFRNIFDSLALISEKAEKLNPDSPEMQDVNKEYALIMDDKEFNDQSSIMVRQSFTAYEVNHAIFLSDSLISNNILKQLYLASILYKKLDDDKQTLPDTVLQLMDGRITIPYIKNIITDINRYYAQLGNASLKYAASLVNTSHLAEYDDAEKLFRELIEPYKGKVIYLDFWGTWCRPCRENIKLSGPLKEHFDGKDVIFMYLANRSPEESWNNYIKETGLVGPNIVHYRLPDTQQSMIERKFSVKSFPTYMLIDKEGNVVNTDAPAPVMKEKAIREIEQILGK